MKLTAVLAGILKSSHTQEEHIAYVNEQTAVGFYISVKIVKKISKKKHLLL